MQSLSGRLSAVASATGAGTVLSAPLRVKLWEGTFREPDIVFMLAAHADRIGEDFWQGADLVIEVLSDERSDRRRDLVTKRREYALAGIAEYWIVDPRQEQITVLKRRGKAYVLHSQAGAGGRVESALLRRFRVDINDVLATSVRLRRRSGRR